ncbi:splicing factor Cactin-like [Spinacia oleracea]|uniref:Splicing factor Cactin-like n=1 Tax=Spinacia oleracea TaxID=3562 RepID=A0ABM3QZV6_SPIOL|nr:splicing factor Cactin-like [Spinacia oleracea]
MARHESSHNKGERKRTISEEDLKNYAVKKALKLAKKLKTRIVSGDSRFVWVKKIERDVTEQGVAKMLDQLSVKSELKRRQKLMTEFEKGKKNREKRALEKARREEELLLLQRERTSDETDVLEKKETEFRCREEELLLLQRERSMTQADVLEKKETEFGFEQNTVREEELLFLQRERAMDEADDLEKKEVEFRLEQVKSRIRFLSMEEGDVVLGSGSEVNLDSQVYGLRKPKFLNRFHTGYEWNKYNRTHYDYDNPPPKYVLGYKFIIFYPDLIDKSKIPRHVFEKDGDSTDTCIIRFEAGPPYQDIGFRIVLKDLEVSHKKGFRCTFEGGILRLYFNFKRYGYRR